jgi:AcrR family transcriptional regulator
MDETANRGRRSRLPWWPDDPAREPSREPLSRSQIVGAALKLIDAEGLEACSMRRLGQELGVGTMSIYGHVRDKDQLIDLVLDEIASEVPLEDDPLDSWQNRVAAVARGLRAVMRRHRHLAPLCGSRVWMGPNSLRMLERWMTIVREAGFEETRLTLAFSTIVNFVLGTGVTEGRGLTGPETEGKSDEELFALVSGMYGSLPPDEYPNLVRFLSETGEEGLAEDSQFEYALRVMLDGLEADLERNVRA